MTDRDATAEAIRRWGAAGSAWHHCYSRPTDWDWCRIGIAVGDVRDNWIVYGRGRNWTEALMDSIRKGHSEL